MPWPVSMTPVFNSVPPKTVYIVAICMTDALLAALSAYSVQID